MTTDLTLPVWVPKGSDRIYLRTPFSLKEIVKYLPGARWDPNAKAWHVPATPAAAIAIADSMDGYGLAFDSRVESLLTEARVERAALVHKIADDANLPEIPGALPAWLHQKRAYHFAQARRSTMLAMDMGTGKSRTAISLIDGWGSEIVVVLCPRSVTNVWPNQFALHSQRPWHVIVPPLQAPIIKRTAYLQRQLIVAAARKEPVAMIVNYEASWRDPMKTLLKSLRHFVLILDESHRIKAPNGKTSKFCAGLSVRADHVLALTGTPMPHSPRDVYAQYRALDPGVYGTNFNQFTHRYCILGGFEGKQVVGYQRNEEFAAKFASASFIVKKDEAGLDLPEVVHVDRPFELGAKSLGAYNTLERDFVLGVGDGTVTVQNALTKLLRLQQVTSGYVRDDEGVDQVVGTDKIDVLADVLEDLPRDEPVVIFARFKHDLREIRELCVAKGRRCGEVSGSVHFGHDDYGLNDHSEMRDDLDVVVLQLQSGGVGIDLTRAAYAIYYSLDFSLGNYDQTLARLDRPGQKRRVTYLHLIARRTKDEVVYQALQQRRDVVDAVIEASRQIDLRAA